MELRRQGWGWPWWALACLLLGAGVYAAHRLDRWLTINATPGKLTVRVGEPFDVRLRVVNSSGRQQSVRLMNCSWFQQWKSSNADVSAVEWDCLRNFAEPISLQHPGEYFELRLPMVVIRGHPGDTVTFRMGFTPIDNNRTYWSNEVTVQLVKTRP